MDTEKAKTIIDEFFEKRPSKEVYEKCLIELISEKHNIMKTDAEPNKEFIDKIDKVIESIQQYLSIASK